MIKIEYKKHLNNIENDVKNTINVLNERNQARIKNEIQMAQKRISEKLHSHYKSLVGNVLESKSTESNIAFGVNDS